MYSSCQKEKREKIFHSTLQKSYFTSFQKTKVFSLSNVWLWEWYFYLLQWSPRRTRSFDSDFVIEISVQIWIHSWYFCISYYIYIIEKSTNVHTQKSIRKYAQNLWTSFLNTFTAFPEVNSEKRTKILASP